MTTYRERLHAGHYEPTNEPEPDAEPEQHTLPRTHAQLDELALDQGHTWSSDDLTVADKQAELNGQ